MDFSGRPTLVLLLRDEAGASLTEYVLLGSLLAVFCITALLAMWKSK